MIMQTFTRRFASILPAFLSLLLCLGLSTSLQAQVIIVMEDVPGLVAPGDTVDGQQNPPSSGDLVQAEPGITVATQADGLSLRVPEQLTIYATEVLDLRGRVLTRVAGQYTRATLRSETPMLAIIRWHTSQGLIVRKVRL